PSIHDPITRCRKSYLNGSGLGKTMRAIRIFKNINMVIFTHTNALAKDFREKRDNEVGEWTPERMGEKKFSRVVIWDKTPSDRILSAHRLSRRIASQKYLELHHIKYPDLPVPLIYRPRDRRKQNCFVSISGLSEKQELVKNDIVHLPLNTLSKKFIKDI
ncbi:16856_t:CDS:2, partial [Racocetra persica]